MWWAPPNQGGEQHLQWWSDALCTDELLHQLYGIETKVVGTTMLLNPSFGRSSEGPDPMCVRMCRTTRNLATNMNKESKIIDTEKRQMQLLAPLKPLMRRLAHGPRGAS